MFAIDAEVLKRAAAEQAAKPLPLHISRQPWEADWSYHERTTVGAKLSVDGKEVPVTIAELRRAFDKAQNQNNWKAPFSAIVKVADLLITYEAIRFFHGATPNVTAHHSDYDEKGRERTLAVTLRSPGYQG